MADGRRETDGNGRRSRGQGYYSSRLTSAESYERQRQREGQPNRSRSARASSQASRSTATRSDRARADRARSDHTRSDRARADGNSPASTRNASGGTAHRSSSRRASSNNAVPNIPLQGGSGSLLGGRIDLRFVVLAIIALALIVIVGMTVSNCVRGGGESSSAETATSSQAASAMGAVSSAAADASSTAASASESAASSEAATAPSTTGESSDSAASTSTAAQVIPAEPGDATYIVAQAAKLAYRDYDFAVDPNRRNWNFDKTNGHKTIYLTFDDGPSANTARVLDILDQYDAKATFFVTGQDPDYFPLIKEAYKRGHTIGLHSMTHDYETVYSSPEGFWQEFDAIGQVVKDQIGYVPCFIRFPGGVSNTISANYSEGIMTYLDQDVQQRGYQYYDWELSCGDGAVLSTEETIAAGCEPTDSENVTYLLHDTAAKDSTVEALPTIIEYYQAQGYTFEALDRSSLVYHHGISN